MASRFDWFAIDYTARVWIERAGRYHFRLISDDGAILSVNGKTLVDNDGLHPVDARVGSAEFSRGIHTVRVTYFQGPRHNVALVLEVSPPGEEKYVVFDTNDFKPPADNSTWVQGKIRDLKKYERPFHR